MEFAHSDQAQALQHRLTAFVEQEIRPKQQEYSSLAESDPPAALALLANLRSQAQTKQLWNLFLPADNGGLSNVDYAPLAEIMGTAMPLAAEATNCNAPDTGNMEVLLKYGNPAQQEQWLEPLLEGQIKSAFCMTEPDVASSDASNISATIDIQGNRVILNGQKWWSTGIGHPDCQVLLFLGVSDPNAARHQRHSIVLVPLDSPGVMVERMLTVFGYGDEPSGHGQVSFTDVEVPAENIVLGPGAGAMIAQGRLGPGRIHHCMRLIGMAQHSLDLAINRANDRTAFGKPLFQLGGNAEKLARAHVQLRQARLLVLHAAWVLDTQGTAAARTIVSEIKAVVPQMACDVIDLAIQLHGGMGLSQDTELAELYAGARVLRLADGPDEVHWGVVARDLAKNAATHA